MKIIYVTTSLEENDYVEFNKHWKVSLNPSNQNFHNKMIRALSIDNEIDVISIRPFSKTNCNLFHLKAEEKTVGNITYHYLKIKRTRLFRVWAIKKQVKALLEKEDLSNTIVIADTINPKCVNVANHIKKLFHCQVVGICTDSPSNITGTTRSYTMYLLHQCQKMDGFITLTEGLNLLYNPSDKKHLTIEGVVESESYQNNIPVEGKYIFFGGALLPRYGVYNLIEAFKLVSQEDISLIICGHHANEEQINASIDGDNRIKYLGILPVKEVLAFEQHSIANINPRPFTQDLDRLSIPSKTLEYLASGCLTISVKNTELEKNFKNLAIWAKSGSVNDLYSAIESALKMSDEERKNLANKAKNVAISNYSIEKVGESITDFLSLFLQ